MGNPNEIWSPIVRLAGLCSHRNHIWVISAQGIVKIKNPFGIGGVSQTKDHKVPPCLTLFRISTIMAQVLRQPMDWSRTCGPLTVLWNIFTFLLIILHSHGILFLGFHVETTLSLILYKYKWNMEKFAFRPSSCIPEPLWFLYFFHPAEGFFFALRRLWNKYIYIYICNVNGLLKHGSKPLLLLSRKFYP